MAFPLSRPNFLPHKGHIGNRKGKKHQRPKGSQVRPYQQHTLPHGKSADQSAGELGHGNRIHRAHGRVQQCGGSFPKEVIGRNPIDILSAVIIVHLIHQGFHVISAYRIKGIRRNSRQ